jgi:aspartate/methionine/tyrosine aminotransferase
MGFHTFQTPYDWGRLDECKAIAKQVEGGMIDLSVGSPVDPVPESVQKALADAADAPNAHGYPATIGTPALRTAIADWFLNCRGIDLRPIGAGLVPTVGSKEAVALMASLLHLGEGDVVVQPRISYPTYEIGTQLAGAGRAQGG